MTGFRHDGCIERTLGAGDDPARVGSNIHTGDELVMALQLVLELEGIADLAVQLDCVVAGNRQRFAVCREGVVGNWVVE